MKKFVPYLTFVLALSISFSAPAQDHKAVREFSYPELNLRTSLTSYLDHDAGIMLGLGYRWSDHFSVAIEPTWIFYNGFDIDREEKIFPKGWKIRTDIKYHFTNRRKKMVDFFIAPEFHYKNVKTEREAEFGINCQNGQCDYFQQSIYTEVKKETGGLLKIGLMAPFPFVKSDQLLFEFYTGLGAKIQRFTETDLPVGGSFLNPPLRNFTSNTDRDRVNLPILPFGLKIIFILKR
ncbi:MAG: hypothetical protein SGI83_14855 [Bacteroidota bacterium]|nr:hypothetical protein [Bacteroidota bacterium]